MVLFLKIFKFNHDLCLIPIGIRYAVSAVGIMFNTIITEFVDINQTKY